MAKLKLTRPRTQKKVAFNILKKIKPQEIKIIVKIHFHNKQDQSELEICFKFIHPIETKPLVKHTHIYTHTRGNFSLESLLVVQEILLKWCNLLRQILLEVLYYTK